MQLIYFFNVENGELFCSKKYEGEEIPANATLDVPPETKDLETVIFEDGWKIKKDYRFTHKMLKKDGVKYIIENIEELGDIPEDYELITNEQAQEYIKRNEINALFMTKLDFYKYVLLPGRVDYATLTAELNKNMELKAVWDLCKNIFRGDEFLNKYIKNYIPDVTDETLDEVFIKYGSSDLETD